MPYAPGDRGVMVHGYVCVPYTQLVRTHAASRAINPQITESTPPDGCHPWEATEAVYTGTQTPGRPFNHALFYNRL